MSRDAGFQFFWGTLRFTTWVKKSEDSEREGSRKVKIISEKGTQKQGFQARGANRRKHSEREGSRKVRILSERAQEK